MINGDAEAILFLFFQQSRCLCDVGQGQMFYFRVSVPCYPVHSLLSALSIELGGWTALEVDAKECRITCVESPSKSPIREIDQIPETRRNNLQIFTSPTMADSWLRLAEEKREIESGGVAISPKSPTSLHHPAEGTPLRAPKILDPALSPLLLATAAATGRARLIALYVLLPIGDGFNIFRHYFSATSPTEQLFNPSQTWAQLPIRRFC